MSPYALSSAVLLAGRPPRTGAPLGKHEIEVYRAAAALHHLVQGAAGTRVSLLPLSAQVTGVTLQGVKYPLRQATLVAGSTLGISNEITIPPVSVEVRSGLLLIVVGHRT